MFTIYYKGYYINCDCDKPECNVIKMSTGIVYKAKSLHAAKCWISKHKL